MEQIKRLKEMGLRISIDDFGTGYSSLAYLTRLPADALKIEKLFVMNMLARQEDSVIVRTIIAMAHSFGLKVVAEGVENQETQRILTKLGCDEAQGYFFGRPLPAAELAARLNDYSSPPVEGTSPLPFVGAERSQQLTVNYGLDPHLATPQAIYKRRHS
jgi:EAL domain-containing protein (putative c-di-GMP-specific phosphodiesterase class I)